MRISQVFSLTLSLFCLPVAAAEFAVHPSSVELNGKYSQTQLVVTQLIDGQVDPASSKFSQGILILHLLEHQGHSRRFSVPAVRESGGQQGR